jgi:Flp pilus assembly protein TadG
MAAMKARTTMRARLRSERGAELIEMMVVTPLLLFIFASIFDFAVLFRGWETVTNAAREGARVASLPAYTADADVVTRVNQYMEASGLTDGTNTSCTQGTVSGTSCSQPSTPGNCSVCVKPQSIAAPGGGTFDARTVTVVYKQQLPTLSAVAPLFGLTGLANVSVGSTSTMRTESPASSP